MQPREHRELKREKLNAEYAGLGAWGNEMEDFPNLLDLRSFEIISTLSEYFGSGTKATDYLNDIIRWMVEEVKLDTNKALMGSLNKRWLIEQYQKGFQNSIDVFSENAISLKQLGEEYGKTLNKLKEAHYE